MERFHACAEHRDAAGAAHERVRGFGARWTTYNAPRSVDCDCPGCKNDVGCYRG